MKYKLDLRPTNDADVGADCPSVPEVEDYPMYKSAFCEDVDMIEEVCSATETSTGIEIESESNPERLVKVLAVIQSRYWDKLRSVSGLQGVTDKG